MISVGIDIGQFSVKLVEIRATAKSHAITKFQEIPLSQDANKDRRIELIDILRNIALVYDDDSTKFVFGIGQQHVSLRFRHFPFKERHKILRSVPFELEDDIPFSQEDSIFEAKILQYVGNGADVLALACPKERIRDLYSMILDGGIEPTILSTDALSLANLFQDWQAAPPLKSSVETAIPEAKPGEMVLDIGHKTTRVLFFSEGMLVGARSIDWGGASVAAAVGTKYGLNPIQALKELQAKAFILMSNEGASRDQLVFSDVIKSAVDDLVRELKLVSLEMQAEFNLRFTSGHLLGGTSQIRNLGPYLTQKMDVAFNRYRFLQNQTGVQIDASPQNEMILGVALGLALDGLKRPRNPAINFLKNDFAKQSQSLNVLWEKWRYTAQIGAAAFVLLLIYGVYRDMRAAELADFSFQALKTQAMAIADLKGRQATKSKINSFIKNHNQELKNRRMAERVQEVTSALDIIKSISRIAPPKRNLPIDVNRLIIDNESVEMEGQVINGVSLETFRKALQNISLGGKVESSSPSAKASPGKAPFGFRFRVDRLPGGG